METESSSKAWYCIKINMMDKTQRKITTLSHLPLSEPHRGELVSKCLSIAIIHSNLTGCDVSKFKRHITKPTFQEFSFKHIKGEVMIYCQLSSVNLKIKILFNQAVTVY